MPLQSMAGAPSLRKGMLGTALIIRSGELGDVVLKGAGHREAHEFSAQVTVAWTRFNLAALDKAAARLDRVLAGVLSLASYYRVATVMVLCVLPLVWLAHRQKAGAGMGGGH